MCQLESSPAMPSNLVPLASEECLDVVDGVEGALEEVIEEVMTEQVKQQLWECVVAALQRVVQWVVERVRAWRQRV